MDKFKILELLKFVFTKACKTISSERGVLIMLAIAAIAALIYYCGHSDIVMATAVIVGGTTGGSHIVDGPVTTQLSNEASPTLLRNEIDQRIVKIRPMATPLDQISRWGGSRHCPNTKGWHIAPHHSALVVTPIHTPQKDSHPSPDNDCCTDKAPLIIDSHCRGNFYFYNHKKVKD